MKSIGLLLFSLLVPLTAYAQETVRPSSCLKWSLRYAMMMDLAPAPMTQTAKDLMNFVESQKEKCQLRGWWMDVAVNDSNREKLNGFIKALNAEEAGTL